MKPIIGISSNQRYWAKEVFLRKDYVKAVLDNGGIPLIIPVTEEQDVICRFVNLCQGIVLSGGGDLNPGYYNSTTNTALVNVDQERDCFEMGLLSYAIKKSIPVLAICRGMQVLNVLLNGTLYQDLNNEIPSSGAHQPDLISEETSHPVYFREDTKLGRIFGKQAIVNSYHHQAIKEIGAGLIVSGTSPDGIIEAVEGRGAAWVIGVQWHPERMLRFQNMNQLFIELIKAAQSQKTLDPVLTT